MSKLIVFSLHEGRESNETINNISSYQGPIKRRRKRPETAIKRRLT
ncbi:unnamed protein product, partial [Rotaria sordida]